MQILVFHLHFRPRRNRDHASTEIDSLKTNPEKIQNISLRANERLLNGYGSTSNRPRIAGFGPCFHSPGHPIFGYLFLTHRQIKKKPRERFTTRIPCRTWTASNPWSRFCSAPAPFVRLCRLFASCRPSEPKSCPKLDVVSRRPARCPRKRGMDQSRPFNVVHQGIVPELQGFR